MKQKYIFNSILALLIFLALGVASVKANIYTVTNTDDTGAGSLQQAILDANASAGLDTIEFNITVGSAPFTIQPTVANPLPVISDAVIIDGYTQPGAFPNTNPPGLGSNAVLKIELDGTNAGTGASGLIIFAGNSIVRGLVINRFKQNGILIDTNGGNIIEGNFIGTDDGGTADLGNGWGVKIEEADNNIVGGITIQARNVISGNDIGGVLIFNDVFGGSEPAGRFNKVQGNFIGTDNTGTTGLGNGTGKTINGGVTISGGAFNRIGGTDTGAGNVISSNNFGVWMFETTSRNQVQGNFIGTDPTGIIDLGNTFDGVFIFGAEDNNIGGLTPESRWEPLRGP